MIVRLKFPIAVFVHASTRCLGGWREFDRDENEDKEDSAGVIVVANGFVSGLRSMFVICAAFELPLVSVDGKPAKSPAELFAH